MKQIKKPPTKSKKDHLHLGVKVAASIGASALGSGLGLPSVGALVSELYSQVLKPPLTKRLEEWMNSVYQRLLEQQGEIDGLTLEVLSKKPLFISTFMQASQVALRNHQEEKLEALRNAVINSAKPNFAEDDIYLMFLNWIDTFTIWHIRILYYLDARLLEVKDGRMPEITRTNPRALTERVIENFPELRQEQEFTYQIIRDLGNNNLMSYFSPFRVFRNNGDFYESYTTDLGKRFIQYINR
jgi:hypothetical protein